MIIVLRNKSPGNGHVSWFIYDSVTPRNMALNDIKELTDKYMVKAIAIFSLSKNNIDIYDTIAEYSSEQELRDNFFKDHPEYLI